VVGGGGHEKGYEGQIELCGRGSSNVTGGVALLGERSSCSGGATALHEARSKVGERQEAVLVLIGVGSVE